MLDLCDMTSVRALLARHGVHLSKNLGQNFLMRPDVLRRIAEASGADEGCGVLEIGPGLGSLTRELSVRAEKVLALELDRTLAGVLGETLADCPNAELAFGDAAKTDLAALCAPRFGALTPLVCANLPYGVTTPVLTRLLRGGYFRGITVMIQKEVARRICARPATADYGAFTLLCQYHAEREYLFEVPPDAFYPAPKVTSAVVRLNLLDAPPVETEDEALLFRVIRASFAQRRKKLLNGLASGFPELDRDELQACLRRCGLEEDVRGETLDLAAFARLSGEIDSRDPRAGIRG